MFWEFSWGNSGELIPLWSDVKRQIDVWRARNKIYGLDPSSILECNKLHNMNRKKTGLKKRVSSQLKCKYIRTYLKSTYLMLQKIRHFSGRNASSFFSKNNTPLLTQHAPTYYISSKPKWTRQKFNKNLTTWRSSWSYQNVCKLVGGNNLKLHVFNIAR